MDDPTLLTLIERVKNVAAFLVAIGVAGEFLGDFISAPIIARRDKVRETEIARLNNSTQSLRTDAETARRQADQFKLDIAKANERAVNAELELAKLKEPRKLSTEQQNRITNKLKQFAGQKFDFNVYPDSEPMALLIILDATLKAAHWERVPSQSGDIEVMAAGATAGTAYDIGVDALISPDNGSAVPALTALASALTAEGLPCTPHKTEQLAGKSPKAILINVGRKP